MAFVCISHMAVDAGVQCSFLLLSQRSFAKQSVVVTKCLREGEYRLLPTHGFTKI